MIGFPVRCVKDRGAFLFFLKPILEIIAISP